MSENSNGKKSFLRKIHVKTLNKITIILVVIFCVLITVSTFNIRNSFENLVQQVNDYAECNKAIEDFSKASDYLTNQIRLLTVNYDSVCADNYFYEITTLQRRENSLELIELSHVGDKTDVLLRTAYRSSNELEAEELYVIKLIQAAGKISFKRVPSQLSQVKLTPEDAALEPEEMCQRAKNIVFGKHYLQTKNNITQNTQKAISSLISDYVEEQQYNRTYIQKCILLQIILLCCLVCVFILMAYFINHSVFGPLNSYVKAIQNDEKMVPQGSIDMNQIAEAFNHLMERKAIATSLLRHKAEHDPLTGAINREGFQIIKESLTGDTEPLAYLMIDIDFFKQINDKYGHSTGDEVLKKVTRLLTEAFRNSDFVIRSGGDEFVVLMPKCASNVEDVIYKKIAAINHELHDVPSELPPVSLSVGAAVCGDGYNPELELQADKALYKVKEAGRCGCAFYK